MTSSASPGDPHPAAPPAAVDLPGWRKRVRQHLADIEYQAMAAQDPLPYDLDDVLDDETIDQLVARLIADGFPGEVAAHAVPTPAELDRLRVQRDAVLALCDLEVCGARTATGYGITVAIRRALGVTS